MAKKKPFTRFIDRIKNGNVPSILKNKYLLTTLAFVTWMAFFDHNDVVSQVKLRWHLHEIKSKERYYSDMIKQVNEEKKELFTNQQSLEKFAREKYMMKKDEEDLFVVVQPTGKK
jgi:hypothetical protein